MKGYALGFAVAAGLASMFGACGGSYCDYGPRCPNDPKTDSQAQQNCRDQYNNVVCDTVTQTSDPIKSAAAIAAKCQGLSDDYLRCVNGQ